MKKKQVNIIGAGMGGLVSGAYLAKKNFKVKIFERLPQIGGCVYSFKRGDYLFEATTHQLAGIGFKKYLGHVFKILGINDLEYIFMPNIFEAVYFNQDTIYDKYLLPVQKNSLINVLCNKFPDEKIHIKNYFRLIKNISNDLIRIHAIKLSENIFPVLYDAITALMLKKAKNNSIFKEIGKWSYRYMVKYIRKPYKEIIKHMSPRLQSLLSIFWVYIGMPPEKSSAVHMALLYHLLSYDHPFLIKGGTKLLLDKLAGIIKENDGEIYCRTPVKSVILEHGAAKGIVTEDGKQYFSDVVISNISTKVLFNDMVGSDVFPEKTEKKRACKKYIDDINQLKLSFSGFQVYIGLSLNLNDYGFSTETNFFLPDYDMDNLYKTAGNGPDLTSPFMVTNYTQADSSFSPPGKTSLVIVEFDNFKRWQNLNKNEYQKLKQDTQDIILEKFEKCTSIPVREKAEVLCSATPRTYQHYMGNTEGEIYGPACSIDQSLLNRTDAVTPFKNLYLAGAYTQTSDGISAVISNGAVISNTIVKSY